MKKILIIAATTNKRKRYFTGLAMMNELFYRVMSKHFKCILCSISPKLCLNSQLPNFKIGNTTILRIIDYLWLMIKSFFFIIFNPKSILYICPAPSKLGFIRDYVFVQLGVFAKSKIVLQIFTGNLDNLYLDLSDKNKERFQNMYNRSSLIITEGEIERNFFSNLVTNSSKVILIDNALPEDRKDKTINPKSLTDEIKLLYLNNMIISKGYLDVLDAVNILINTYHLNVKCDFVGRFIDNDKIQERKFFEYIKKYKLNMYVKFIPGAFGQEKKQLFENANFFLLPSYFPKEGKPTAIIEAMSYGCVPIVTNYREIPEMVNPNNGIFVEEKNGMDIAKKIKDILNNKENYESLSLTCLKDYEEKYTAEIYEQIMYLHLKCL